MLSVAPPQVGSQKAVDPHHQPSMASKRPGKKLRCDHVHKTARTNHLSLMEYEVLGACLIWRQSHKEKGSVPPGKEFPATPGTGKTRPQTCAQARQSSALPHLLQAPPHTRSPENPCPCPTLRAPLGYLLMGLHPRDLYSYHSHLGGGYS